MSQSSTEKQTPHAKEMAPQYTSKWIPHLVELRKRLMWVLLTTVGAALGAYAFKDALLSVLLYPLNQAWPQGVGMGTVVFTSLTDPFFVAIKLALYTGLAIAFPVLVWQVWLFVRPGLFAKEQKSLKWLVCLVPGIFYSGCVFAYFVVLPLAAGFFLTFADGQIQALPDLAPYVAFSVKMMLAFGLAFTFPLWLLLLVRMRWVSVRALAGARRFVILGIFIAAAVLTPPDPLSQLILAIPLWGLYEGAVLVARRLYAAG